MTRRRRWALGIAAAVVVALAILPLACDREHRSMDAEARRQAPGRLVQLRDGAVHHELAGPEAGARVVLIHGVSGPMAVWDRAVPALTGAGLRVLRYDH